jgi:hypothetical protein
MQSFIRFIKKRAVPLQIVPIIVSEDDRLEADALFTHIARLKHILLGDQEVAHGSMIFRDAVNDPHALDSLPAAFFKRGEMISHSVQASFCAKNAIRRYQDIDLILMMLQPSMDQIEGRLSAVRKEWINNFQSVFAQPLMWPKWSERAPDHRKFFLAAYKRLTLPSDRNHSMPKLLPETMDYLRQQEFAGTVAAEQFFKSGFSNYLRMDPNGTDPLLVEHFTCIRRTPSQRASAPPTAQPRSSYVPNGL